MAKIGTWIIEPQTFISLSCGVNIVNQSRETHILRVEKLKRLPRQKKGGRK